MKYLVFTAVAAGLAVGVAMAPVAGHAGTGKKVRASHDVSTYQGGADSRVDRVYPDASGGNAAAGGNNANSMTGSNSAAENANGRTSGGGGFGG